jgi:hypothetical protein
MILRRTEYLGATGSTADVRTPVLAHSPTGVRSEGFLGITLTAGRPASLALPGVFAPVGARTLLLCHGHVALKDCLR